MHKIITTLLLSITTLLLSIVILSLSTTITFALNLSDLAYLSKYSYVENQEKETFLKEKGFSLIEKLEDNSKVEVYKYLNKHIIVFRGTHSIADIKTDFFQSIGTNGKKAIIDDSGKSKYVNGIPTEYENAHNIVQKYIKYNPYVVGHSLGGGMTSYTAIKNNLVGYTFNTAPLSNETIKDLNLTNVNVKNYVSFNKIQDIVSLSSMIKGNIIGETFKINVDSNNSIIPNCNKICQMKNKMLELHSIDILADSIKTNNDIEIK